MATTIKAITSGTTNEATKWQEVATTAIVSIDLSDSQVVLSGDVRANYPAGTLFTLTGTASGTDDGAYEVASVAAELVGGNTVITTVVAPAADDVTAAGTSSINRVPEETDELDVDGYAMVQEGAATFAALTDTGSTGSFEITDDLACASVTMPVFSETTKNGDVPILLDFSIQMESSSPVLEIKEGGLVEVGAGHCFYNFSTGAGVTNAGTIVGSRLSARSYYGNGIENNGDIACDEINGVADDDGEGSGNENGYGILNYSGGEIFGDVDGAAQNLEGIENEGTITGAVKARCAASLDIYNSGTINLIGVLDIVSGFSAYGTIQSAYDDPPTDIIGAGML